MDLIQHIERQREFSINTFGPGERAAGIVAHIRSELSEIEKAPDDVEEWIDVVMLALDGAWRAGHSSQDIANALTAKLVKNENRNWPDWRNYREGEAIEHIPDDADSALFKKGDIIRHGVGSTALMRVDSISRDHGGVGDHRYYGRHCMGGAYGCYHADARPANDDDLKMWSKCGNK